MKAKVVFPAVGNESQWRPSKFDPAKRQCTIVVEAGGKTYALYANEGTSAWTATKDAEIDVDVVSEPEQPGKHGFAKLAGLPRQGGGGNFAPRKTYTAKEVGETAGVAARLAAYVYATVRKELTEKGVTDASAEDVRAITNTLIIELVKRLP